MLDIAKLAKQIPGMGEQMKQEAIANLERVEIAQKLLGKSQKQQKQLVKLQQQWSDKLNFTAATPMEALNTKIPVENPSASHSVFATDGSQIAPSHHEIAYCYLLNIGRIMLHYGQNLHPFLDSIPEIYYKHEDLYVSRKWGIRIEEWMGYLRSVAETEVLADMACNWLKTASVKEIPNLAMTDGSLIYWFLETLPIDARNQILNPILAAWEELYKMKIPLIGYVSASRSIESINFLRFAACTYEKPNCVSFCNDMNKKAPCQVVEPLRDATLAN
jgi:hypothetical protein